MPSPRRPGGEPPGAEQACLVANRTLTQAEWELFLPDLEYDPACRDWGSAPAKGRNDCERTRSQAASPRLPYWLKPLAQPILRWLLERAIRQNLENLARLAEERSAAT